jgi:hypothetical protein
MDNGFVWAMTPQQLAGSLYNVIHAEDDYLFIHVVILRWNILKNIAIFLDRFGTRNIVMVGCPGEAFLYYPASGATCWVSDRSNNDFKTLHNNGLEENIFQMTEIPSSFPHRTLR